MVTTSARFRDRKRSTSRSTFTAGCCQRQPGEEPDRLVGQNSDCSELAMEGGGENKRRALTNAVKFWQMPAKEWQSQMSLRKSYMSSINPLTPFCTSL